jgi:hypothetical protein
MTKIKALGGILLGCLVMIVLSMVCYNIGFVANITGIAGAIAAIFLGMLFSKGDAPIFTAVMTGILCLATAFFVSIYLPAKEVTEAFSESLKENQIYYSDFMEAYEDDPNFAETYENDPDEFYAMVYEDWAYLTETCNGDVEEFTEWYDAEWITPVEDRAEISYWFAHAGTFISGDDEYLMETDIDKDVFNLLLYNILGVILAICYLVGRIAKGR